MSDMRAEQMDELFAPYLRPRERSNAQRSEPTGDPTSDEAA